MSCGSQAGPPHFMPRNEMGQSWEGCAQMACAPCGGSACAHFPARCLSMDTRLLVELQGTRRQCSFLLSCSLFWEPVTPMGAAAAGKKHCAAARQGVLSAAQEGIHGLQAGDVCA